MFYTQDFTGIYSVCSFFIWQGSPTFFALDFYDTESCGTRDMFLNHYPFMWRTCHFILLMDGMRVVMVFHNRHSKDLFRLDFTTLIPNLIDGPAWQSNLVFNVSSPSALTTPSPPHTGQCGSVVLPSVTIWHVIPAAHFGQSTYSTCSGISVLDEGSVLTPNLPNKTDCWTI